ncbi:preprotein translocase subunit YajC [Clostridium frigidicarnis]|uniref:Preprotein translocase subunit YajC n=1 Tax=Clostridium frigidicarnis TaxID=84698 RepID=A0A1I0VKS1_9CLOT|nr:preprotein translocase subunit YajC [Clostridium frigidicarnis]SFA76808.1 preprotein translocase subunit YajC [Clostridium frigidicarnis]
MQQIMAFLPFIVMLAVFYFLIILPENKRKKKYSSMLGSINVNDEILTRGGIIGKVINIKDDYVIVESGPDRARFKIVKNGIADILNTKEENEEN